MLTLPLDMISITLLHQFHLEKIRKLALTENFFIFKQKVKHPFKKWPFHDSTRNWIQSAFHRQICCCIYLFIQDGKKVCACICQKTHIVNELKANILAGTDVLGPEKVILYLEKREAFIGSCDVTISIQIRARARYSV